MANKQKIKGAEALLLSLIAEGTDTIFGYPGGQVIPIYDHLYHHTDRLHHILTRHEQGAVHAAQGYARATGKVGVCLATSGPAAPGAYLLEVAVLPEENVFPMVPAGASLSDIICTD